MFGTRTPSIHDQILVSYPKPPTRSRSCAGLMKHATNYGRYGWKEVRPKNFSLIRRASGMLKAAGNGLLPEMGAWLCKTSRRPGGRESVFSVSTPLRGGSFAPATLVFVHFVIVLSQRRREIVVPVIGGNEIKVVDRIRIHRSDQRRLARAGNGAWR